jgi:formate dehydrogenase iron-sulfur subunit
LSLPAPRTAARSDALLDALLREQRDLSAAARFARWHDDARAEPALAPQYRSLIPLSAPKPGEQYAFEVDLQSCSGCKACVTACHALNGLDENESWRNVGLLVTPAQITQRGAAPVLQHITTACHHCVEPGCLKGCPVLAYDKDPLTGIVRHLDDQCIGCAYCVMMCPYDAPKYSSRLGIVRKCDMCHGRLEAGEAPACVQACPTEAIRIGIVSQEDARRAHAPAAAREAEPSRAGNSFLPGSPEPSVTIPTTRYLEGNRALAGARPADEACVAPAEPHWELVGFLALSQLSTGLVGVAALLPLAPSSGTLRASTIAALLAQLIALGVATLHLGQPLRAWRAFLGWRSSWFSREVIAFGAYTGMLALLAFLEFRGARSNRLELATLALGVAGVASSVMIYAATRRAFWSAWPTAVRFGMATLALGGFTALALGVSHAGAALACLSLGAGGIALGVAVDVHAAQAPFDGPWSERGRSAALLGGPLRRRLVARVAFAAAAIAAGVGAVLAGQPAGGPLAIAALVFALASVALERHLFFAAVSPDRMPGGVAA